MESPPVTSHEGIWKYRLRAWGHDNEKCIYTILKHTQHLIGNKLDWIYVSVTLHILQWSSMRIRPEGVGSTVGASGHLAAHWNGICLKDRSSPSSVGLKPPHDLFAFVRLYLLGLWTKGPWSFRASVWRWHKSGTCSFLTTCLRNAMGKRSFVC